MGVLRELLPNGTSKITGFQLSAMIGWHAPFLRVRPYRGRGIFTEKTADALYSELLSLWCVVVLDSGHGRLGYASFNDRISLPAVQRHHCVKGVHLASFLPSMIILCKWYSIAICNANIC